MFNLNPCNYDFAWWQHLLMLLGAGILGYLLGNRSSEISDLEGRLAGISGDLDDCLSSKKQSPLMATKSFVAEAQVVNTPVAAVASAVVATVVAEDPNKTDDLKVVEGIGPKIEELFYKAGIKTWKKLSETSVDVMQKILDDAGPRYRVHDPATWAEQSKLADEAKWEQLKTMQDELNKGKRV
jgi:predicted flap endonuclease-1-like 5' DNA nuclease